MIIHKPDWNIINAEADRIEKESHERGDFPELQFLNLVEGNNIVRILPPYNATGRIFRRVVQHWELPPDKRGFYCLVGTWPDDTDTCYVCDMLEKVSAKFPTAKLGRQGPASKYRVNVISRTDEDKGTQILRCPESVYNWVIIQMRMPQVGDVTDIENGIDLNIVKEVTKRKDGKTQIRYKPSWIPRPSPLSSDDELVAKWSDGIFDLDRITKYPSDEKLGAMHSYAMKSKAYYMKKFSDSSNDLADDGDDSVDPDSVPDVSDLPDTEGTSDESEQTKEVETKQSKSNPKKRSAEVVTAKSKESTKSPETGPRSMPACFAGNAKPEPHDGPGVPDELKGKVGFCEDLEKCLLCEHEIQCSDAKVES